MPPTGPTRLGAVRAALGDRFDILRPVTGGGMASVYVARERALGRVVALKVLEVEQGAAPEARARFRREAELAARVSHPNIVPVFATGEAAGVIWISMMFVEGETLAEHMQAAGLLPVASALRHARDVLEALGAAHRCGVVHRDVKPQNIMVDRDTGRAMLMDFGIASVLEPAADHEGLTGVGRVMGTPRYMSPEQAAGERTLTAASDLYAVGLVLYEMLTGQYPYRLPPAGNHLVAHLTQPVRPARELRPDLPPAVGALLDRLLAKSLAQRVASAGEALALLERARASLPPAAPRRWIGRRAALALAAAVVVATAGAMVATRAPGRPAPPPGTDPRQSLLLGAFDNTGGDADAEWLRLGAPERLARLVLDRQPGVRVVGPEAAAAPGAGSLDELLARARASGAWTAAMGSVLRLGGRTRLSLRIYDVATGLLLRQATAEAHDDAAIDGALAALAEELVQVTLQPAGRPG